MEDTAIVPNSDIVGRLPLEATLEIMISDKQLVEPLVKHVALSLGQTVDVGEVEAVDRLPSSDRVGANDWMHGFEIAAAVFWRPTSVGVD